MRKKEVSKRENKRKNVDPDKLCRMVNAWIGGKKAKQQACRKEAVAVIRMNGKEYFVCKEHRTDGVYVRPIK